MTADVYVANHVFTHPLFAQLTGHVIDRSINTCNTDVTVKIKHIITGDQQRLQPEDDEYMKRCCPEIWGDVGRMRLDLVSCFI